MPRRKTTAFLLFVTIFISRFDMTTGALSIPLGARWSFNATTVAGSSVGSTGSTLSLLYQNNGIYIDDNDTLYIADTNNHRIVVIRPNSTNASSIIGIGYGSGLNQMNSPYDVSVTADAIYVLDSNNYRVVKFFKNGTNPIIVSGSTSVSGSSASNTTFGAAVGLAVDDTGAIYVSDTPNYRVIRFPPNSSNGTSASKVGGTGATGNGWLGLVNPREIFVDSTRALYIADSSNNRIQKWNFQSSHGVTVAGGNGAGSNLDQLNTPNSLVVDDYGQMYIVDKGNNRILRLGPDDCVGYCIAGCSMSSGTRPDQFNSPSSIAFDSQGALYVSDTNNHRVQRFSLVTSASATTMSTGTTTNPPLVAIYDSTVSTVIPESTDWTPNATTVANAATLFLSGNYGLRIADNDTLYIADRGNHRVTVKKSGSINASLIIGTGYGSGLTQMVNPADVFVTNDAIFVLDSDNYRIVKWSKNGTNPTIAAGRTGVSGSASSNQTFGSSFQLFVDIYGSIYVSDQNNHRILRFPRNSSNGTTATIVAGTGASGTAPNQLSTPGGLFVDDSLTVFIADTNNHRIQKFKFSACRGETCAGQVGNSGSSLLQLSYPTSVVVDSFGYMYITDKGNNRIIRFSPGASSGLCLVGCAVGSGSRYDQLSSPFTVAFDSGGSLYVSDTSNSRVQRFSIIPPAVPTTIEATGSTLVSTAPPTTMERTSTQRPSSMISSTLANTDSTTVIPTSTANIPITSTVLSTIVTSTEHYFLTSDSISTASVSPVTSSSIVDFTTSVPTTTIERTSGVSTITSATIGFTTTTATISLSTMISSSPGDSTTNMPTTTAEPTSEVSTITTAVLSTSGSSTASPTSIRSSMISASEGGLTANMPTSTVGPTSDVSMISTIVLSTSDSSTDSPTTVLSSMISSSQGGLTTNTPTTTLGLTSDASTTDSITTVKISPNPVTTLITSISSTSTVISTTIPTGTASSTTSEQSSIVEQSMTISSATATSLLTIANCSIPVISLIPFNPNGNMPWYNERGQPFSISSLLQLYCPKSLSTRIQWAIMACRPSCSYPIQLNSSSTTLSELFLPARSLDYGLYQMRLTVGMRVLPVLTSSMSTYLSVIPSPITVNLVRSGSSMITIGRSQNLTLDPGSFSIDPDQVNFNRQNWNYVYYYRIDRQSNFMLLNQSSGSHSSLILPSGLLQSDQISQFRVDLINLFNATRVFTGYVLVHVIENDTSLISVRCVIAEMNIIFSIRKLSWSSRRLDTDTESQHPRQSMVVRSNKPKLHPHTLTERIHS